MPNSREILIATRNELMAKVDAERTENKKHGIKHLGPKSRKILDQIWNIDEQIMNMTETVDLSINEDYEYEKEGGFDHMST